MRILVTNDDGVDSVGLHILARAMRPLGDVSIVAPDQEFSGASSAIGAIWAMHPEVHAIDIEGVETSWCVSGPPALCVMFARLGAFGPPPDLIVSGINPGANVGRSVYHSGTIGAALTGRNGRIPGIAVSQSVDGFGVEGQGWEEALVSQRWDVAAAVAATVVEGMIDDIEAGRAHDDEGYVGVLNVNVPNVELDEIKGFRWTEVALGPPRSLAKAVLEPKLGHERSFHVKMDWGQEGSPVPGTDTAAVLDNEVSLTWLSRIVAQHGPTDAIDTRLGKLL
jgi:5'-nucleotidase